MTLSKWQVPVIVWQEIHVWVNMSRICQFWMFFSFRTLETFHVNKTSNLRRREKLRMRWKSWERSEVREKAVWKSACECVLIWIVAKLLSRFSLKIKWNNIILPTHTLTTVNFSHEAGRNCFCFWIVCVFAGKCFVALFSIAHSKCLFFIHFIAKRVRFA